MLGFPSNRDSYGIEDYSINGKDIDPAEPVLTPEIEEQIKAMRQETEDLDTQVRDIVNKLNEVGTPLTKDNLEKAGITAIDDKIEKILTNIHNLKYPNDQRG